MTPSARARRAVGRKRRRIGFPGQVLAPLVRSLSSQPVVDLGNSPGHARFQGHVPFRAPARPPFVVSTVGDSLETGAEGSPNSSEISNLGGSAWESNSKITEPANRLMAH